MGTVSGRRFFRFRRRRGRARAPEAAGAAGSMDDGRIVDVDGYVHVVDGTVVCFGRHMFRLSSDGDREALFGVARRMRGRDGVCVLTDLGDDSGNYTGE